MPSKSNSWQSLRDRRLENAFKIPLDSVIRIPIKQLKVGVIGFVHQNAVRSFDGLKALVIWRDDYCYERLEGSFVVPVQRMTEDSYVVYDNGEPRELELISFDTLDALNSLWHANRILKSEIERERDFNRSRFDIDPEMEYLRRTSRIEECRGRVKTEEEVKPINVDTAAPVAAEQLPPSQPDNWNGFYLLLLSVLLVILYYMFN